MLILKIIFRCLRYHQVSSATQGLFKDVVEFHLLDLAVAVFVDCLDKLITLFLRDLLLAAMR